MVEVSCLDSVERYKGGREYKYIVLECEEDSPHRTVPAHANILFLYCVSLVNCVVVNCPYQLENVSCTIATPIPMPAAAVGTCVQHSSARAAHCHG